MKPRLITVGVSGLRMLRAAFEALLSQEPGFRVVEAREAEVVVHLRIVPTAGNDEPVVATFAVVQRAGVADEDLEDEAFIGLHEDAEELFAEIRRSVETGRRLLN